MIKFHAVMGTIGGILLTICFAHDLVQAFKHDDNWDTAVSELIPNTELPNAG